MTDLASGKEFDVEDISFLTDFVREKFLPIG